MTGPRDAHPNEAPAPDGAAGAVRTDGPAPQASAPTDGPSGSDEQALRMREAGRSYVAIARELGFSRSTEARSAFVRAVRQLPGDERSELFRRETHRLDELEERVRGRDGDDQETMERRLAALARLRQGLE